MKHKTSGAPPQQEELRDSANAVKPLEASPVKEIREEQPIEHTFDCGAECDGTQNFFRYRDRDFFSGPIFSGTGTGTFFRDQFFPVPGPVLFFGTNFFRYRYRYFFLK